MLIVMRQFCRRPIEAAMRSHAVFRAIVMTAALAGAACSADATEWCAQYRSGASSCGFKSFEQCLNSVSGIGGLCNISPYASVRPAERSRRRANTAARPKPRAASRREKEPARATTDKPAPAAAPAAASVAVHATPPAAPKGATPASVTPAAAAPPDPTAFAAARRLILAGHYQAGLTAMRALRADSNPDVACYIGLANRKLGRNDEAQAWYEKALTADPGHLQTLAFYGVLLADQGELAAARLALAKIRLVCGNTRCNEYVGLAGVIAAKAK
jgi:Protein of unknown function (DUF3551)/Tetratricopeptide repeat